MYYIDGALMQKTVEKETIVAVRFAKHELQKIDEAAKRIGAESRSAFLRQAAERYVEEVGGLKIIEIRETLVSSRLLRRFLLT